MRRRNFIRTALSLPLGAITTLAVAWAAAVIDRDTKPASSWSATRDSAQRMWMVWYGRTLGRDVWEFWQHEPDMLLPRDYDKLAARFHPPPWVPLPSDDQKNLDDYTATAFGLPALCLKGTEGDRLNTYLNLGSQDTLRLPVEPIWRGLAIDTGGWGAGWALLLLAPGMLRSRRRVRRGCCPHCGYNMSGTGGPAAGCPECGWGRTP